MDELVAHKRALRAKTAPLTSYYGDDHIWDYGGGFECSLHLRAGHELLILVCEGLCINSNDGHNDLR